FAAVYDGHSSHHGSEHASHRCAQVHRRPEGGAGLCGAWALGRPPKGGGCAEGGVPRRQTRRLSTLRCKTASATAPPPSVPCGPAIACTWPMPRQPSGAVPRRQGPDPDARPQAGQRAEERERIESHGGHIVYEDDRVVSNPEGQRRSRLNMSRALGDPDFKQPRRLVEAEPDVARLELRPGSDAFLLLGSDGLFEQLSVQQAVDITRQARSSTGKALW
ncbi:hypothetical protein ABPG77_010240, partial [Micractinium sp. CCAP 211/92]